MPDAPITRDAVRRSYHQDYEGKPMVNVKVQSFDLPDGDAFDDLVDGEFADLDPKLARLDRAELRAQVDRFLQQDGSIFDVVCEGSYEYAEHHAQTTYFPDYSVRVWSAGRSGGWAVVEGLPDVDTWGPDLLTKWSEFETFCHELVADVPRGMAWHVLANCQDELAGRIMRFEVTLTLSDADLDKADEDPSEWEWRDMLGLDDTSKVYVRRLKD
jgi:hypothetical protein